MPLLGLRIIRRGCRQLGPRGSPQGKISPISSLSPDCPSPAIGESLLPFGGGERVCLGKALAELEIRLMAVGLLGRLRLQLAPPDQDLALQLIPSPSPRGGLLVLPLPPPEPRSLGSSRPPLIPSRILHSRTERLLAAWCRLNRVSPPPVAPPPLRPPAQGAPHTAGNHDH